MSASVRVRRTNQLISRDMIDAFAGQPILVIGDIILDRYVWGDVHRISPEAPVPVVRTVRTTVAAGGAANVAANIATLGGAPTLVGIIGSDVEGAVLVGEMETKGLASNLVLAMEGRPTTTKTRVIGGNQQMLRLDIEDCTPAGAEVLGHFSTPSVRRALAECRALVLSDYAKGVLTAEVCREVIQSARSSDRPVIVDPKGRDFSKYKGATALTPNRAELAAAAGLLPGETEALLRAGQQLKASLDLEFLVVTRGDEGMSLIDAEGVHHFPPSHVEQVFDVSGAGDTAIATLALGIAAGLAIHTTIELANVAAGISVTKLGTAPVAASEVSALLGEVVGSASSPVLDSGALARQP